MSLPPFVGYHVHRPRATRRPRGAHALVRAVRAEQEPVNAQAERLLYFGLVGAIEAELVCRAEEALTVLRQASQPLGPMAAEWLEGQERRLEGER